MSRRPATMDDLQPVHRIYMHEAVTPLLGYDPMPIEAFRPIFEDLVASETFYAFEADGELAGFYKITRFEGHRASPADNLLKAPATPGAILPSSFA